MCHRACAPRTVYTRRRIAEDHLMGIEYEQLVPAIMRAKIAPNKNSDWVNTPHTLVHTRLRQTNPDTIQKSLRYNNPAKRVVGNKSRHDFVEFFIGYDTRREPCSNDPGLLQMIAQRFCGNAYRLRDVLEFRADSSLE